MGGRNSFSIALWIANTLFFGAQKIRILTEPTADWGPKLQVHRLETVSPRHTDSQVPLASQYDADIDNMDGDDDSDDGNDNNGKGGGGLSTSAYGNRSYGDTTTTRSFGHGRYILASDGDSEGGTPRTGSGLAEANQNNLMRDNNQLRDGFSSPNGNNSNSNSSSSRIPKFEIGSFNETNF